MCSAVSKELIIMGDLNARTTSLTPFPDHPPRQSKDTGAVDARGRMVLQCCRDNKLFLLNGVTLLGPQADLCTSFHTSSSSNPSSTVIDCVASSQIVHSVKFLTINSHIPS